MAYIFVLDENNVLQSTKFFDEESTLKNKIGCNIKTHYYDSIEFYGTAYYDNEKNKAVINGIETEQSTVIEEIKVLLPKYISLIKNLEDNEITYKDENYTISLIEQFEIYATNQFNIQETTKSNKYEQKELITLHNRLMFLYSSMENCRHLEFSETLHNLRLFLTYSLYMIIFEELLNNEVDECNCVRKFCSCEEQNSQIKDKKRAGYRFLDSTIHLLNIKNKFVVFVNNAPIKNIMFSQENPNFKPESGF